MTIMFGLELLLQIIIPCLFINSALFLRALTLEGDSRKKMLIISVFVAVFCLVLLFVFGINVDASTATAIGNVQVKNIKMKLTIGIGWIMVAIILCFLVNVVHIYFTKVNINTNKIFDFKCIVFNLLGVFLLFFLILKAGDFFVYQRFFVERVVADENLEQKKVIVMIEEKRQRNWFTCEWIQKGNPVITEKVIGEVE